MGVNEAALEVYEEALSKGTATESQKLAIRSAKLLLRIGDPASADQLLKEASNRFANTMTPDETLEMLTLQASVARQLGEQEEALAILEDIVQRDGTQGEALLELAQLNLEIGNPEKAYFLFERAQNLSDEMVAFQSYLKHAQALVKERKYQEASKLLEQALRIKDDSRTRDFLDRVQRAMRS